MAWLDEIIQAFRACGGTASLQDLLPKQHHDLSLLLGNRLSEALLKTIHRMLLTGAGAIYFIRRAAKAAAIGGFVIGRQTVESLCL